MVIAGEILKASRASRDFEMPANCALGRFSRPIIRWLSFWTLAEFPNGSSRPACGNLLSVPPIPYCFEELRQKSQDPGNGYDRIPRLRC